MFCHQCGQSLLSGALFCHHCGTPVATADAAQASPALAPAAPQQTQLSKPGRGGTILALGIISIVFLGPITGIPAWIMGHGDLKQIRAGSIAQSEHGMTMAGMILGIVGTGIGAIVLLGIMIAVGVAMLSLNEDLSLLSIALSRLALIS